MHPTPSNRIQLSATHATGLSRAILAFAAIFSLSRAVLAFAAIFSLLQADPVFAQTASESGWFNADRTQALVLGIILTGAILLYVVLASAGRPLFIRKIAGLETVEEAVGRATEMGKPILYVPGLNDMDEVQTIASMNLLGHLATIIAGYDSRLHVPVRKSLVMSVARETVQQSYLTAGRPDAYREDDIHYVSDAQFAYAAAVDGIIVREKPAACFYLGGFYAESLILAETGNSIGAIQIAGTAQASPAALLRGRLRLHADRRGTVRRQRVPVQGAAHAGQPEGAGRRQGHRHPVHPGRQRAGHPLFRYR